MVCGVCSLLIRLRGILLESRALLVSAWGRVRVGSRAMLVAFALAELVAAQVLIPLTAGVVNWMVRRSGHYAVANEDLIRFFLSWVGLATLLVAGTVTLAIDGMGRGAMMLALRRAERDKQASGVLAFIDALRREGVIG